MAAGSRPADTILVLPISQSWYTLPDGSAGSPLVTTTSWCRAAASTTVATPPLVVERLSSVTCGEDRSSEIALFSAWAWLSCCWVWACAKPKSTATTIEAVATTPESHGTHGTLWGQGRVRRGRAWVLTSGGNWRVRAAAASTRSRSSGGGSAVAAKASAVATSRNPRTSLAHDWQRFM